MRNLVLDIEDLGRRPLVARRPELKAGARIDQRGRQTQHLATAAHRAFQDRVHAKLFGDGVRIEIRALERERRRASGHLETWHAAELADELFRDAIAEELLRRIATHVDEWHDSERRIREAERMLELALSHQQH